MSRIGLKPFIVPVFLPHQGCPHRCIFCDQHRITDRDERPLRGAEVGRILEQALGARPSGGAEVAFYGGTFTRLPVERMEELLLAVQPYREKGAVARIRVSTRPDALDPPRLETLRRFGVTTVELGAQSMDAEVLRLAGREHSPEATREGVAALRGMGFKVGIQLMPGLPGDTIDTFRATIQTTVELRPDMVRLYPAIVIDGTVMAEWYRQGRYRPLTVEEAVHQCAEACRSLEGCGIPVIRLGLMPSPALCKSGRILAGPWHPAFGSLVRAAIYRGDLQPQLRRIPSGRTIRLMAPQRDIPLLRGHRNQGLAWVEATTGSRVAAVLPDDSLLPGHIRAVET